MLVLAVMRVKVHADRTARQAGRYHRCSCPRHGPRPGARAFHVQTVMANQKSNPRRAARSAAPVQAPQSTPFWRLKKLRNSHGLTLDELQERTGLTKSYLSKVERGLSVPSISTALKLAEVFGVAVGELFGPAEGGDAVAVVRRAERRPVGQFGGATAPEYEALSPNLSPNSVEAFLMRPPHTLEDAQQRFEHDGEELMFVIKGRVELVFPDRVVVLANGDSAAFSGHLPHRCRSLGTSRAEVLVVVSNSKTERRAKP
jgi:transcriptional regulator with XRE-family HTH domain